MKGACTILLLLLLVALSARVRGHGMLIEPVNRASMWKFGFDTPEDFNDNQLYCGGKDVQWLTNKGKCGECGDNWALPRPRPHENTGEYGTGMIVKEYSAGQAFTARVNITANHRGWFYFRLCPLTSPTELETQDCFDQHPVETVNGEDLYPLPSFEPAIFEVKLQLPPKFRCDMCVLQWTYKTGNSWGICPNGTGALGCGPQEHFRTCSDIAIH